jgi:mannose-1-phosphate guanylyltransferase
MIRITQSAKEVHLRRALFAARRRRRANMTCNYRRSAEKRRMPADRLWIAVLAGGHGRRLQAFVRDVLGEDRPKQFCRFIGHRSMLRHTWDRALGLVPATRVVTAITAGQEGFVAAEASHGIPGRVLVQPANRETGPGLLLPLLWIVRQDPEALVAVFPADHFIWEESRFLAHVAEAIGIGRRCPDRIVLLGMEPEGPETSYGWIEPGPLIERAPLHREVYAVTRFWEKPDLDRARALQQQGCLWNSFVMAGAAHAFLQLARVHLPELVATVQEASRWFDTSAEREAVAAVYRRLRPMNFSREILEPGQAALMVQAARGITWSDWGEPDRILQTIRQFDRRPTWLAARATPARP